jgi:hypothetical protein
VTPLLELAVDFADDFDGRSSLSPPFGSATFGRPLFVEFSLPYTT